MNVPHERRGFWRVEQEWVNAIRWGGAAGGGAGIEANAGPAGQAGEVAADQLALRRGGAHPGMLCDACWRRKQSAACGSLQPAVHFRRLACLAPQVVSTT